MALDGRSVVRQYADIMKWFSSFRAKLICTVFPVVAAVTVVALLMAERKFSAAYRHLFEEQFEQQIETLTSSRKRRFEALSQVLEQLASQPEILKAVEKRDFKALGQVLRPQLENLASERLQSEFPLLGRDSREGPKGGAGPKGGPGGPSGPSGRFSRVSDPKGGRFLPGQAPFIGLIDEKGKFISVQQQRTPSGMSLLGATAVTDEDGEVRRKGDKLPWLEDRKLEDVLSEQEVGYLRLDFTDREGREIEQVREVFITPLREQGGKFLGAFLFGLPLPVQMERALYEQTRRSELGEIMSGVLVEDELVTTTIPAAQRKEVAALVSANMLLPGEAQRELMLNIGGVRHEVFYRVLNPGSPFPLAAQVNLYPLSALDEEIRDLRRNVGAVAVAALLVALVVVLWISRNLSGPVTQLAQAAREIERGNFDVRVPVKRRDELGALAFSFNQMAAGLALQDKYRSVLNAVADPAVAQRLIEQTGRLGGELRHVTMLFCDIRGFTTLTENMPPGEVIDLLNEHMTLMTEIAYAHDGIVDKFVGDLIMVLFGAPVSCGSDAARAVQCAQAMLEARAARNAGARHPIEVGIGIATGSVVAGCMGSDQRLSYTVLGHSVNLASRLCGIAAKGEIIMDDETYAEARSLVQAQPLEPVQLKGISSLVQPWRVVG